MARPCLTLGCVQRRIAAVRLNFSLGSPNCRRNKVYIRAVLTHAEYGEDKWKE